jgi:hypothetical protein
MKRPTPKRLRQALDAAQVAEFKPSAEVASLRDMMDLGTFTAIGWKPPPHISREGLQRVIVTVAAIERCPPWAWADVYLNGGDKLVGTDGWIGPDQHTLQNYVSVAKRFPHSRRRERLSFAHPRELVALTDKEQDELLDWCEQKRSSVKDLRAEKQRRADALLPKPPKPEPLILPPEPAPDVVPPPAVPLAIEPEESPVIEPDDDAQSEAAREVERFDEVVHAIQTLGDIRIEESQPETLAAAARHPLYGRGVPLVNDIDRAIEFLTKLKAAL